jgi:hypothetical protein
MNSAQYLPWLADDRKDKFNQPYELKSGDFRHKVKSFYLLDTCEKCSGFSITPVPSIKPVTTEG